MNVKQVTLLLLVAFAVVLGFAAVSYNRAAGETIDEAAALYTISAHANRQSLAFTYWEETDPPVIPVTCARCHSTQGLLDYLGEDGSEQGQVDEEAPTGMGVQCVACHNEPAHDLDRVVFDSGAEFSREDGTPVCMICHQTRASTPDIANKLAGLEEDGVVPELSFIDPHYKFAASTQVGALAASGYQYSDQEYAGYYEHAYQAETCTDCHSPHSLQVDPQRCSACHTSVVAGADFRSIRFQDADFDGDGETGEGIHEEIQTLRGYLYTAIQEYASQVGGVPVVYEDRPPYFFEGPSADGSQTQEGNGSPEEYNAWTPRLIKAAYNYQFSQEDSGGYVHNPRYVIQLLHDSLLDLGEFAPVPPASLARP